MFACKKIGAGVHNGDLYCTRGSGLHILQVDNLILIDYK